MSTFESTTLKVLLPLLEYLSPENGAIHPARAEVRKVEKPTASNQVILN